MGSSPLEVGAAYFKPHEAIPSAGRSNDLSLYLYLYMYLYLTMYLAI